MVKGCVVSDNHHLYEEFTCSNISITIIFPPDKSLHLSTGSTSTWKKKEHLKQRIGAVPNLTHICLQVALPGVLKSTEPHIHVHVHVTR